MKAKSLYSFTKRTITLLVILNLSLNPLRGLAGYTGQINVKANDGWLQAGLTSSKGNRAVADSTTKVPSVAIPKDPPDYVAGPAVPPDGTDPGTVIQVKGVTPGKAAANMIANNGDSVDNSALDPLITPTSVVATGAFLVVYSSITSNQSEYSISWSGSDQGVASRVQWYEYRGIVPTNHSGPYTNLFDWSSMSTLLREELRIGPWTETTNIVMTENPSYTYVLFIDGAATSLPKPRLQIAFHTNNIFLRWPNAYTNFMLRQNSSLATRSWVDVTNMPTVVGTDNQVIVSPPAVQMFYQLVSP